MTDEPGTDPDEVQADPRIDEIQEIEKALTQVMPKHLQDWPSRGFNSLWR